MDEISTINPSLPSHGAPSYGKQPKPGNLHLSPASVRNLFPTAMNQQHQAGWWYTYPSEKYESQLG